VTEITKRFLTDDIIRALPPSEKAPKIHRDADIPGAPGTGVVGYGVRVTKAGTKALVLQYRNRETGEQPVYTIGRWPRIKAERGREIARGLRAKIEEGFDPHVERVAKRNELTVAELADRFEAEVVTRKKSSTQDNYSRLLRLYIRPHLGRMKVNSVTLADTERLSHAVTEAAGPYQANRIGAVGSTLFTAALRWALRSPALGNPFKHLERHKEHHRRRYPKHDELHRLVTELAKRPDRQSANAILLLMYTGARRGEVLGMKWADVSLADGTWRRKAADLKQARNHDVPLSPQALQVLRSIADEQSKMGKITLGEYVFPSASSRSKHLVVIRRLWRNVVKAADLGDLRIHDLRHGFASQLVSAGASLPLIGSLLGHSSPAVTQRYAHLFSEVEREAVTAVGKIIEAASLPPSEPPERTPSGDVIKISGRRRKPT
jgi:integrase